jgi:fermentation-respiration switch protein FrsA (DUF1100 family)
MVSIKFIGWLILSYVGYCVLIYLMQRPMLFPRQMTGPAPGPPALPGLERLWIQIPEGKLEAWFIPPGESVFRPAPVVIFAHGNAELIDFCAEEFSHFSSLGLGLLLVEYPGYGRSAGSPSQQGIARGMAAAYDRVAARGDVDPTRIVLMGRSLGGGAAAALSRIRPSAAMILISTFTSVRSFARRYLAPTFLVRDPFDNLAALGQYQNPVLIIHGRNDEIIPYAHGVSLAKAARRSQLISYDCGHNDCPPNRQRFWEDIETFLRQANILELAASGVPVK